MPNEHRARRTFDEWAYNEMVTATDFHNQIHFSGEAYIWFNEYVKKI